jgi:hypothetical protein
MKKPSARIVSETNKGIYVWQLANGEFLADGLNILSINAVRGDIQAMSTITNVAKGLGYPDGRPVFQEGYRKITDEEFEIQYTRLVNGYIPDPLDELKGL